VVVTTAGAMAKAARAMVAGATRMTARMVIWHLPLSTAQLHYLLEQECRET